jgi:CheY-like chemotaxis protein
MAEPLVYIIDDDKANNFLTRIMLEDAGIHNFKQFRLAEDALAELQRVWKEKSEEEYPLLILLDINMPAMDGWGFLNEFRKLPEEFRSIPKIYLLTSSDYHGDLEKVGDFPEVIDYLDKPVTDELAKRLKEKYFSPSFE